MLDGSGTEQPSGSERTGHAKKGVIQEPGRSQAFLAEEQGIEGRGRTKAGEKKLERS